MEEGAIHGRTINLGRNQFHSVTNHLVGEHCRRHPMRDGRDREHPETKSHPERQPWRIQTSAKQRLIQAGLAGERAKHTLAIWLILIYAFIAILSWTITCLLTYQPTDVPTYFDQYGNHSRSHYQLTDRWRKAAGVGQTIVGVISIPVTSAICAKVAAVYCQENIRR